MNMTKKDSSRPSASFGRKLTCKIIKMRRSDKNFPAVFRSSNIQGILPNIKGTGPDGRIVKAYVEASRGKEVSQAPKDAATTTATLDYTDIPHTQIRKVTASRLLLSKQTIPHYYLTIDTCVDKLLELSIQLNALQEGSSGKRISINDLVIKAAALALRKVP